MILEANRKTIVDINLGAIIRWKVFEDFEIEFLNQRREFLKKLKTILNIKKRITNF